MILDEARAARARLARANEASSNVAEAEALAKKKKELREMALRVDSLSSRRRMLRQGNVPLSPVPDVGQAKKMCSMILTRFEEDPKSTTLVNSQRWIKLQVALAEFNTAEETLQKQDWKNYYSSQLFGGLPPEQRKQTIVMTLPKNREAMDLYRELYKQFSQYRNSVPDTNDDLEQVQAWSRQLSVISQGFVDNESVPTAVREFFNATSLGSGASLELLTPEVFDWLRANNMLNNYAVRAR